MKIRIETASPSPRAAVRFLNGLLLLRYGLASMQVTDQVETLSFIYFQRSVRLFESQGVSLLSALGTLALPPNDPEGALTVAIGGSPITDDVSPLDQLPFSAFPLEGFAVETLLQETIDDQGFDLTSVERGSIEFVIEDGLDRMIDWLKKLLGQALDLSQSQTPADQRTYRGALRQGLQTVMAESTAYSAQSNRAATAGILVTGTETIRGALADMGAASVTISGGDTTPTSPARQPVPA